MRLTQSLHRNLQQGPDEVATVFGDRVRTWRESADVISRLAGGLRGLGVGPGDRVAILSLNSDRYHELLYGTWWAGGVVNPVNVRWSVPEIAYSLEDCQTRVLFVDEAHSGLVESLRSQAPGLQTVVWCGEGDGPRGHLDGACDAAYDELIGSEPVEDAGRGGDDLAGVFYTGGTTGFPKGVMLSHRNLVTSALGAAATGDFVVPGGALLHAAPMFHLADLAAWMGRNLVGGSHVILPSFTPDGVLEAIERHRPTDALLVPTMIQLLVDAPGAADRDLSALRKVLYGASPISEGLLDRVRQVLPAVELTQAYGMTELGPIATLLGPQDHLDPVRRRSAGRAAPHAMVRIVDDLGRELPRGEVGEITIHGDHVMQGYWGKPEETCAALRDGWMHSGDGGRMDEEGYVFVVDRIKDMIVSGGENVYSVEVESAITTHPSVAACAVVGVPDDDWGERVHAFVVVRAGGTLELDDLRAHCRERIAGYKCPRSLDLVDVLPTSGAGKVLKRELRQRYWSGAERAVH